MVILRIATAFSVICLNLLMAYPADRSSQEIQKSPFEFYGQHREQLEKAWNQVQKRPYEEDQQNFKNYTIYLVSGISTQNYPPLVSVIRALGFYLPKETANSFQQQKNYFKKKQIKFKEVSIYTNGDPDENGDLLAKTIFSSPNEKAIIISHSKGGVDVLHSFMKYPELKEKVHGWITLQTPFFGTPLAKLGQDSWIFQPLTRFIQFILTNGKDSVGSLDQNFRHTYYERNKNDIAQLTEELPIIGLGSWFLYGPSSDEKSFFPLPKTNKSLLDPFIRIIFETDGINDGLVPLKSTCLPGIKCFTIGNLDHANPVMKTGIFHDIGTKKRIHLTRVFLYLLLEEIEKKNK
jgi:hypothetical protein